MRSLSILRLSHREGRCSLSSYNHIKSGFLLSSLYLQQRGQSFEGDQKGDNINATGKDRTLDVNLGFANSSGSVFSRYTCLSILKKCVEQKSISQTMRAYTYIMLLVLEPPTVVQDNILLALAKLGAFDDALFLFDRMAFRTSFSWTAIITGFADHGQANEAIQMYQYMLMEGVEPDRFTFISLFKACGSIGDLIQSKDLHLEAQRTGYTSNTFVGNTLISMYGKCGGLSEAEDMFSGLAIRSVVSWTAMVAVYVENNQAEKGLLLFRQMKEEGTSPNDQTFVSTIQACGVLAEMEDGCRVHGDCTKAVSLDLGHAFHVEAWRAGFVSDIYIVTTLVSMYGKCGAIADAEMTFNNTSVKHSVASWTALISAYAECGHGEKALLAYRQMQDEGVRPNEQSLVCTLQVLTASNSVLGQSKKAKSWEIGQALHADAYTRSFASEELLGNVLVSMYGKHGVIEEAESVFTGLSQRSIVSWTAMLSAYVEQGEPERALQAYNQLQEDGYPPNEQTMVIALQACGMLAENDDASLFIQQKQNSSMCLEICQSLHTDAERKCLVSDVFVSCALLNAYSKCGVLLRAQEVFCAQPCYDTASWNAMIAAHVEHNQGPIGLQLYGQMLDKGKMVDAVTLMNALQACNKACILEACRDLHFVIVSSGHDLSLLLVSSLIHAYGSCSSMSDAESTHDGVTQADVVLWNACIASYAEAGSCEACSQNLENMVLADMQPDGITFASVISSCNHTGFVHEGTEYFKCMLSEYRLNPDLKHYAAIIDLLGRAGDFKRLENVLWRLPRQPDLTIWLCVLGSCYKHGNFKLGRFVLYNALGLESKIACAYNCAPGLAKN